MDFSPQELATKRRNMALEYRNKMKELADIKKRKAFEILKLMATHKTMAKAEAVFAATDDGQKELELTFYLKGLLEVLRATKTEIDILQAEAYNQY